MQSKPTIATVIKKRHLVQLGGMRGQFIDAKQLPSSVDPDSKSASCSTRCRPLSDHLMQRRLRGGAIVFHLSRVGGDPFKRRSRPLIANIAQCFNRILPGLWPGFAFEQGQQWLDGLGSPQFAQRRGR